MSKSNEVELKSCPFCGGKPRIAVLYGLCGDKIPRFSIECTRCEVDTPMTMDKDGTIVKWNTRHNEMVELDEKSVNRLLNEVQAEEPTEIQYCSTLDKIQLTKAIYSKFGQRQMEDVGELVEMIRVLLDYYKSKINSPRVIYFKGVDIVDYAEKAIAKFKEKKD